MGAASRPTETNQSAIAAVWRDESARLIGALVRFCGDVDAAEDLAQEALVRALDRWPQTGIPDKPGAWLTTTAKRIAIDHARHRQMADGKRGVLVDVDEAVIDDEAVDVDVKDDVLRLMLIACHPVLPKDARVALTLRWVAGLQTAEIARAFLTSETTLAQRLVRAKRTLAEARVPYELPTGAARRERIPRCSRSSTSCSTRATPRAPATTSSARPCARRRCASRAASPS
jgi:RNA polymerase sigma-70 factor (ECF subfamily)